MVVISNTTPIISLSSVNRIHLLKELFNEIIIPSAVYSEIKAKKGFGFNEVDLSFFKVRNALNIEYLNFLMQDLDRGESECILLAKELKADVLIIDERLGYKIARQNEIFSIGTLSVLALAKKQKLIKKVKPLLDELIEKGRWYDTFTYNEFLKSISEL